MIAVLSLLLRCLSLLGVLVATNVVAPSTAWGYDAQPRPSTAYDGASLSAFDFDSASVLAIREKQSGATGNRVLFAKFAKLVAAEAGAAIRSVATLADQDIVIGFVQNGQIIKQATLGSDFATAISHEQLAIQSGLLQGRGILTEGVEAFTVVKQNGQVFIRGSNNFVPTVSPATEALLKQFFK